MVQESIPRSARPGPAELEETAEMQKSRHKFRQKLWSQIKESCIPILMVGSLGLVVQSATKCHDREETGCGGLMTYGIVVGSVSFVIAAVFLLFEQSGRYRLMPNVLRSYSIFLSLWWTAAVCVLTWWHQSPFQVVGNGYYCTWAGFIASTAILYVNVVAVTPHERLSQFKRQHSHSLIGLWVSSIIVTISAISSCVSGDKTTIRIGSRGEGCDGEIIWVLACGALSTVICSIIYVMPFSDTNFSYIASFLVLMWLPGLYVATFRSPFVLPGNGYYASWYALLFAVAYAIRSRNVYDENDSTKDPIADATPAAAGAAGGQDSGKDASV